MSLFDDPDNRHRLDLQCGGERPDGSPCHRSAVIHGPDADHCAASAQRIGWLLPAADGSQPALCRSCGSLARKKAREAVEGTP